MEFECKICRTDFSTNEDAIKHYKLSHEIESNINVDCTVKNSKCGRCFQTYKGLKNHVRKCLSERRVVPSMDVGSSSKKRKTLVFNENAPTNHIQNEHHLVYDADEGVNYIENEPHVYEEDHGMIFAPGATSIDTDVFGLDDINFAVPYEISNNFLLTLLKLNLTDKNMNEILRLTETMLEQIRKLCKQVIESKEISPSEAVDYSFDVILNDIKKLDSSHKRNNFIEAQKSFIKPLQVAIGTHWANIRDQASNIQIPVRKQSVFHFIPPSQIIQNIFSRPKVLQTYLEYNQETKHACEPNVYRDFCCGNIYRDLDFFQNNPNAIQLQFFFDGFEISHPLKSKKGLYSHVAVYMTIRNMPPQFSYNMNNIFLVCLVNENDLKKKETNYFNLFEPIVEDLKPLRETGVKLENGLILKCAVVNFTFDNLGGNVGGGFAQSFAATHFCRMCLCTKSETKQLCKAVPEKYRNLSNYAEAIDIIKESTKVDLQATKGISEYCILNDLEDFHIVKNWSADVMHDLSEGCMGFSIESFFEYALSKKVFRNMAEVNTFVSNYDFGTLNSQFIPSEIKLGNTNLGQNASQMKTLMLNFPFIFHKYKDHADLETAWVSINSMIKIVRICYSNKMSEPDLEILGQLVEQHLLNMKTCFKKELKPKQHFMTHYPEITRRSGPLCLMSALRFEMKHKQLTNTMKNAVNHINVTKSIIQKYLHSIVFNEVFTDHVEHSKLLKLDEQSSSKYRHLLADFDSSLVHTVKHLQINSDYYAKRLILKHNMNFFEIEDILKICDDFYFVCSAFDRINYDDFLISVEIKQSISTELVIIKHSHLTYSKTHDKKMLNDKIFVLSDSLEFE